MFFLHQASPLLPSTLYPLSKTSLLVPFQHDTRPINYAHSLKYLCIALKELNARSTGKKQYEICNEKVAGMISDATKGEGSPKEHAR